MPNRPCSLGTLDFLQDGSMPGNWPTCQYLPPLPHATSRKPFEPFPAWITQGGFIAEGPKYLHWGGRRYDSRDEENFYDRPFQWTPGGMEDYGMSRGGCDNLFIAQNVYHDGYRLCFDVAAVYRYAMRPFLIVKESKIKEWLESLGDADIDDCSPLTEPLEGALSGYISLSYGPAIVAMINGWGDFRPFSYPLGDNDTCPNRWNRLYGSPQSGADGKVSVHAPPWQRRPPNEPLWRPTMASGFFGWREVARDQAAWPDAMDCKAILRRAWLGSNGNIFGPRYGSFDAFMEVLPPFTAFDLRLKIFVHLVREPLRDALAAKESQATYDVEAYRISGSPPCGVYSA